MIRVTRYQISRAWALGQLFVETGYPIRRRRAGRFFTSRVVPSTAGSITAARSLNARARVIGCTPGGGTVVFLRVVVTNVCEIVVGFFFFIHPR